MSQKLLMDAEAIDRALRRMAHEIIERNPNETELLFVGILRGGVPLAYQLAKNVNSFSGIRTEVAGLDITLYRDDMPDRSERPAPSLAVSPEAVTGHTVILVDDVFCTGRSARAAMEAVIALGRPSSIQLAVLVDRGHRELPIRGDFVGKNVPTSKQEEISVRLPEYDGEKAVLLLS